MAAGSEQGSISITQQGLLVTIWLFTAIAIILFAGRLMIKSVVLHRFFWDDFFSMIAFVALIVSSILYTLQAPYTFRYADIATGKEPMPAGSGFMDLIMVIRKYNVALQSMFWLCLYAVKFSFLFLYRLVLVGSASSMRAWWAAVVFVILTMAGCLVAVFAQCGPVQDLFNMEACSSPSTLTFIARYMWVMYALNLLSDFVVMILPLPILWRLQMRVAQKIAVTAVCLLALIIVAFDTLRAVQTYQNDIFFTILYTSLETEIAVIVCMLPAFRFLISGSEKSRAYRRAFFSRITLGSYQSDRSVYAMHSTGRDNASKNMRSGASGSATDSHPDDLADDAGPNRAPYISNPRAGAGFGGGGVGHTPRVS